MKQHTVSKTEEITVKERAIYLVSYVIAMVLIAVMIFGVGTAEASGSSSKHGIMSDRGGTNVGDGETYSYVITEIVQGKFGEEIRGIPLTKAGLGNRGIVLRPSEVSFDVEVGTKVAVIWGEEEDEFASITEIKGDVIGCQR